MSVERINNVAASYKESAKPQEDTKFKGTPPEVTSVRPAENGRQAVEKMSEGNQDKENQDSDKKLKDAITQANNKMKQSRTSCEFSYHEEINRVSIRVIDRETKEVIREIPPEENLKMIEKMWEIAGLMLDQRG